MRVISHKDGTIIIEQPDREIMFLMTLKPRLRMELNGLKGRGPSAKSQAKQRGYFKGNLTPDKLAQAIIQIDKDIEARKKQLYDTRK